MELQSRRTWLTRVLSGALAGAATVTGLPTPARASSHPLSGNFRYRGGQKERDELEAEIDSVVSEMNFLIRSIARSRLREATTIGNAIAIAAAPEQVRVDLPGHRPIVGPGDGQQIRWKDPYGEWVRVRNYLQERRLLQRFAGEEGSRDIDYRLHSDVDYLRFQVTIRSSQLPRDLSYRLTYGRS